VQSYTLYIIAYIRKDFKRNGQSLEFSTKEKEGNYANFAAGSDGLQFPPVAYYKPVPENSIHGTIRAFC
jgi:hypothetical protein